MPFGSRPDVTFLPWLLPRRNFLRSSCPRKLPFPRDEELAKWLRDLNEEMVNSFTKFSANKHKVWHATIGPNDALLLPVGYMIAERIGTNADLYGMKSSLLLPSDLEAYEKFDKLFISQAKPDAVLQSVIDTLTLSTV